jgi:hypothetical protein
MFRFDMPTYTAQWLQEYYAKRKTRNRLQDTVTQRLVCDEPLGQDTGKEKGPERIVLRVTSLRSRLIDPDNLCAKYLVDAARYLRLIKDDSAAHIEFQIVQQKVPKADQKTILEITYP